MLFGIGVVILIVGIVVNCWSDFGGLIFYLVWFLVRPQETWLGLGGSIPMERIFAIFLIGGTLLRYKILDNKPIQLTPPMKAFAALVFVNYLTIVTSIWRSNSLDLANKFGKLFLMFFCASIIINTEKRFRIFLWTYVICLGWEAGSTIQNYYANPYFAQGIQRAEGLTETWGDPNAEAFNLILVIPYMLAIRSATKKWKPTLLILAIIATAITAVILTGSRMGLLVLIFAFLMMTLRSSKRFVLLPGLCFIAFFTWLLMPPQYKKRFETVFTFAEDPTAQQDTSAGESAYGRVIGFRISMMEFRDHPILGVGAGNFPDAWLTLGYTYKGQHGWHQPHNLPGEILSEQGIVGGIAFVVFVVVVLRSNVQSAGLLSSLRAPPAIYTSVRNVIPVVITCLLLQGFSSHCYYRYNWYMACTLAGMIFYLSGKLAAGEEPPKPAHTDSKTRRVGPRLRHEVSAKM